MFLCILTFLIRGDGGVLDNPSNALPQYFAQVLVISAFPVTGCVACVIDNVSQHIPSQDFQRMLVLALDQERLNCRIGV